MKTKRNYSKYLSTEENLVIFKERSTSIYRKGLFICLIPFIVGIMVIICITLINI